MQGVFVDGQRPASKKAIKEALADNPARVVIEATSAFGGEYDGSAQDLPAGTEVAFCGPDPFTKRNFYGQIVHRGGKVTVR